jgi:hypothetical protein
MLSDAFMGRFVTRVRELLAEKSIIGQRQVVSYLGRYTNRTVISNDRILNVTPEKVTFYWRDYANNPC